MNKGSVGGAKFRKDPSIPSWNTSQTLWMKHELKDET